MRVPRSNPIVKRWFLNNTHSSASQRVKWFVKFTNGLGKYDQVLKKCAFCCGVCFACSVAYFQIYDWLKNKRFQIKDPPFIAYARTGVSKSEQFNFVADVVEIIAPAVVHIEGHGRMSSSSGSGFLVTEDGLVLTNAHVVQNMRNVTVTLTDGSSIVGDIVSLDQASDLAAVQLRNASKVRFFSTEILRHS